MATQYQKIAYASSKRPRHSGHFTKRSNRLTRQRRWLDSELRPRDHVADRIHNKSRPPTERKLQSAPIEESWVSGLFDGQVNLLSSFGLGQNPERLKKKTTSNFVLPKKTQNLINTRDDTNVLTRFQNKPEVRDWIQREECRKRKYCKVMMKPDGPGVGVSLDGATFSRAKKSTRKEFSKRAQITKPPTTETISPWKHNVATTTVFLRGDYQDKFLTNFPIMDLVEPTWQSNLTFAPLRKVDHLSTDTPLSKVVPLPIDSHAPLRKVDPLPRDTPLRNVNHLPITIPLSKVVPLPRDTPLMKTDPLSANCLIKKIEPFGGRPISKDDLLLSVDRKIDPLCKESKQEERSSTMRGWPATYHNDTLDLPVKHESFVRYWYGGRKPVYCPVGSVTFRRSVTL